MASEDFAFMLQAKAGAYCFIGNGDGAHRERGHGEGPCMLHNPSYDFNDALIPLGATYWVRLAEAWLASATRHELRLPDHRQRHRRGVARPTSSRRTAASRCWSASRSPATTAPAARPRCFWPATAPNRYAR